MGSDHVAPVVLPQGAERVLVPNYEVIVGQALDPRLAARILTRPRYREPWQALEAILEQWHDMPKAPAGIAAEIFTETSCPLSSLGITSRWKDDGYKFRVILLPMTQINITQSCGLRVENRTQDPVYHGQCCNSLPANGGFYVRPCHHCGGRKTGPGVGIREGVAYTELRALIQIYM